MLTLLLTISAVRAGARNDAPALLLVHGFGAFGEQWRGQVKALTAAGYQARRPAYAWRDCTESMLGSGVPD